MDNPYALDETGFWDGLTTFNKYIGIEKISSLTTVRISLFNVTKLFFILKTRFFWS